MLPLPPPPDPRLPPWDHLPVLLATVGISSVQLSRALCLTGSPWLPTERADHLAGVDYAVHVDLLQHLSRHFGVGGVQGVDWVFPSDF